MSFSFPRSSRLISPSEFQRVFQRGLHRRIQLIGLLARVRESIQPQARLGFAVSKRSLKRAVDRNRVKRLVRESFRHHKHLIPPVDIVILANTEVAQMDNAVILRQLEVLWQRLGKLYPAVRVSGLADDTHSNL